MISAHLRLPRTAYLAAGALAVCVTPMVQAPWLALVYLLPIAAFAYVARSGTVVDAKGITARALIGSVRVPWSEVIGLRVSDRGQVFALLPGDEQLRLPAARPKDVAVITAVSKAVTADVVGTADPDVDSAEPTGAEDALFAEDPMFAEDPVDAADAVATEQAEA